MIETPRALFDIEKIASAADDASSRLEVLVLGPNDIAKSTRARLTPGRPALLPWLSAGVLAARVHDIEIIDGIYNDFNDEAGLRREAEQGRDMGIDGKMLIHPNQIGPVNEIFAPSAEEVDFARRSSTLFDAPENLEKRRRADRRPDGRAPASRHRAAHAGADGSRRMTGAVDAAQDDVASFAMTGAKACFAGRPPILYLPCKG